MFLLPYNEYVGGAAFGDLPAATPADASAHYFFGAAAVAVAGYCRPPCA